ncbi:hypothetical protein [Pseudomonas amygdali]|uniref:hypothetical protein n=1 Tax=Pseudomonas amygdali TaxID=47877 RepID=UPI0035323395
MSVDIEKLEALAKASAGEWYEGGELRYEDRKSGDLHGLHHDDERFIAAANPAVVLELTQTIRDLRSSVSGLKTGYEAYERVNAELRAERKALRKDASLHSQLQRAAEVLPGAWSVEIVVEHHAGWIDVFDDGGNKVMFDGEGHLADQVSDAIDLALTLSKEDSQ